MQAVQKLAAATYVDLYPDTRMKAEDLQRLVSYTGKREGTIRHMFKSFRNLGRAYHNIARLVSPAAPLLLGKLSSWLVSMTTPYLKHSNSRTGAGRELAL